MAALVGAPAAVAFNSPMAALHTALLALGIGPGDGVVVSPLTGCHTLNAIEQVGARPILVDVERESLTLDVRQAARVAGQLDQHGHLSGPGAHLTDPTVTLKAIAASHDAGHLCDLAAVMEVARTYRLAVVEDATQMPGTVYRRDAADRANDGDPAHVVCFGSLSETTAGSASGGVLVGPVGLMDQARVIGHHGWHRVRSSPGSRAGCGYEIVYPGFDFAMTEGQAQAGLIALDDVERSQAQRAAWAARYNRAFARCPELETPGQTGPLHSAWSTYVLRLNMAWFGRSDTGGQRLAFRDQFVAELNARGVAARLPLPPMHLQPYYRDKYGYQPDDFPVAYGEYRRMLFLPLSSRMTDDEVEAVIAAVGDGLAQHRRSTPSTSAATSARSPDCSTEDICALTPA